MRCAVTAVRDSLAELGVANAAPPAEARAERARAEAL